MMGAYDGRFPACPRTWPKPAVPSQPIHAKQVAVCIAGVARTIGLTAYNTYKLIIEPIEPQTDVFMAMDLRRGAGTMEHYVARDRYKIKKRFKEDVEQVFGKWTEAEARKWIEPLRPVLNEHSFADSDNETMTLSSCLKQVLAHEGHRGFHYKWLMRVRPDTLLKMRMPGYELWPTWLEDHKVKQLFTSELLGHKSGLGLKGWRCNKGGIWALLTRSAAHGYFEPWASPSDTRQRCLTSGFMGVMDECRLGCGLHLDRVHVAGCTKEETLGEILRGHYPDAARLRNMSEAEARVLVDVRAANAPVFEFQCVEHCHSNASYSYVRNVTFGQKPWAVLPRYPYGLPMCGRS